MGNCNCYGGEPSNIATFNEFPQKSFTTISTATHSSIRYSQIPPLPRLDPQPAIIAISAIKNEQLLPIMEAQPPCLNDAVRKTIGQLSDLVYDDVERGEYFKCQRFFDTQNIYQGQTIPNGSIFTPHGKGNLYYTDGSFFTGTFVNGKAQGRGRLVSSNGSYYEGTINNNKMEGRGQYRDQQGTYEGSMLSGIPHGQGTYTTDKIVFKGRFDHGEKVEGTLTWGDQDQYVYTGPIKNDLFEGEGKLVSPCGIYKGKFQRGLKEGFGMFTWSDGKKFEGTYKEDKKVGYGEYYDSDGTPIYKGQWQSDKPAGKGIEFKRCESNNKLVLVKVECQPKV